MSDEEFTNRGNKPNDNEKKVIHIGTYPTTVFIYFFFLSNSLKLKSFPIYLAVIHLCILISTSKVLPLHKLLKTYFFL